MFLSEAIDSDIDGFALRERVERCPGVWLLGSSATFASRMQALLLHVKTAPVTFLDTAGSGDRLGPVCPRQINPGSCKGHEPSTRD